MFGNLSPQADVGTHQRIDLGVIQFPSLRSKSVQRASRSARELDAEFFVRGEAAYYSFNNSL